METLEFSTARSSSWPVEGRRAEAAVMRGLPEPVLSEAVQQRLELLLAEVEPRHAIAETGPDPVQSEVAQPAAPAEAALERLPDVGVRAERLALPEVGAQLVGFAKEHLAAVVIVLLVACGWAGYSVLQVRTTPVAAAAAPASVVATPSPSVTPPELIVVHVLGAVTHPGVVELPSGSRVQDAIEAAEGLTGSADPAELNFAAVLADGSQLVIGTKKHPRGEVRTVGGSAPGTSGSTNPGGSRVSLNTATLAELDLLPGVGPVTAQKIIDWREAHGSFTSVEQLQEVDGIGPKTYAELADRVQL